MSTTSITSNEASLNSASVVLEATATNPEYNQPALRIKQASTLGGAASIELHNQRLLNELGWHHDPGNVRRLLAEPRIEPTNIRAAWAFRPAVIARKVSHGSKNGAGAYALAAITSVVRTLAKQALIRWWNACATCSAAQTFMRLLPNLPIRLRPATRFTAAMSRTSTLTRTSTASPP